MKDNFKTYPNLISTLLRETKESYYKRYLRDNKETLKLVSQTTEGITNTKNKSGESISGLLIDNQLITSAKQVSNHFNNFFLQVLLKKINRNSVKIKKLIFLMLALKTKTQIFFLQQYLRMQKTYYVQLKMNKASGPNSIPTNILTERIFKTLR